MYNFFYFADSRIAFLLRTNICKSLQLYL